MVSDSARTPNPKCCPCWNHSMSLSLEHQELSSDRRVLYKSKTAQSKGQEPELKLKNYARGLSFSPHLCYQLKSFIFLINEFYSSLRDRSQIKQKHFATSPRAIPGTTSWNPHLWVGLCSSGILGVHSALLSLRG